MDFVRELLLRIESGEKKFNGSMRFDGYREAPGVTSESHKLLEHLRLLEQAGFVDIYATSSAGIVMFRGLSWSGHDFIDTIRDPKVWDKTKKGAEAAGGFTVDLLKDLAKGLIKKQIEEYTCVKL